MHKMEVTNSFGDNHSIHSIGEIVHGILHSIKMLTGEEMQTVGLQMPEQKDMLQVQIQFHELSFSLEDMGITLIMDT